MKIAWLRGNDYISYNRPHTFFVLGRRGSGKSSLIEEAAEQYLKKGHKIFDLFGSRDGEGLAWLRNPMVESEEILLVHGDNVDVSAPAPTCKVSDLSLTDFDNYRIMISSSPLYSSIDDEFYQVNRITDLLYKRMSWKKIIYVLVREAANLYYSRLKVANNQTQAKADMTYLVRESRHMGLAMGLDTLKFTSIDIDIRAVIDYLIFKAQGVLEIPRTFYWMLRYVDPAYMRRLKPNEFVIVTNKGNLGIGVFNEIPWHKKEKEHILNQLGIEVEYGEPIQYGENRGTFQTLGDTEHAELIRAYIEGEGGMNKIAEAYGYSGGTVHNHIKRHNKELAASGECSMCRRVESGYYDRLAKRS